MDTDSLVDADVKLGERATEALLADSEVRPRAALWWLDEERERTFFVISTPLYEKRGLQAAYLKVRKILEDTGLLSDLPLERVWIVDDRHPILEVLRNFNLTAGHIALKNCVLNGSRVGFAYIYLLQRRRARPRKKIASKG